MAKKEDIFKRIERVNPRALEIIRIFTEKLRKRGEDCRGIAFITEDMTRDEIVMACLERNLRLGMPPDEAKEEAEKHAEFLFEELKIQRSKEWEDDTTPKAPS